MLDQQVHIDVSVILTTFLFYTRVFLPWNERRHDLVRINDPLLACLPVYNTWLPVTLAEQMAHVYYIYLIITGAFDRHVAVWSWTIMIWMRCALMFVCPLKAPRNAQPLYDFTQKWLVVDEPFENDLFFSGHVSACCIMALTSGQNEFFITCLFIVICMLFSKVHYTIDLAIAPMAAYCSHHMSIALLGPNGLTP